jgi:cytochrome P450
MDVDPESRTTALPPGPRLPGPVLTLAYVASRQRFFAAMRRRYGSVFTLNLPPFGPSVVVCDAALCKQLFMTSPDVAGTTSPNLGNVLGEGSTFALDGAPHRARRKLMVPPFHGRRLKAYEGLIEEEVMREAETWPQGVEFETQTPFLRLTLNIILRAVFGAEGADLGELRSILPGVVELGARLSVSPFGADPDRAWGGWRRWRQVRAHYDEVVDRVIDKALADPRLDERDDVLAMLLQSRYDDGEPMSREHIRDELLTMLGAGHETTANTLAWAVERLRREPALLHRLVAEVDAGRSELLEATVYEVQRARPVILEVGRLVLAPVMPLGPWRLPKGCHVLVAIDFVQNDPTVFPDPEAFRPDRFVGTRPDNYTWIPFGGGTRRCIGAAFAHQEMVTTLRLLLREFEFTTTHQPDERWQSRGVAWAPGRGGRAVLHRRSTPASLAAS